MKKLNKLQIKLEKKRKKSHYVIKNDFRKITLIRAPAAGGSTAIASTLRGTKAVRINSTPTPGTFVVDEELNQASTGAVGKVVEWDSTNRILYYMQS